MKSFANLILFLVMCLMFWLWGMWTFTPENAINLYQVSPNSLIGLNALKSDMAGSNLIIGLFLLAYFLRGTKWLIPAAITISVLLLNRVISLLVDGYSPNAMDATIMETLSLVSIIYLLKKHPSPRNYAEEIHPSLRSIRFINMRFQSFWQKNIVNKLTRIAYDKTKMSDNIETTKHQIKGYEDKKLTVEVYQKQDTPPNAPCILALHGGGFWLSANPNYKYLFEQYIRKTGAKVVMPDYTLSIKAPYPHAPEDCYQATLWTYNNADMLGIDKNKIAIYGDSAGGALAGAVTQMLRDRNKFRPCFQMLIYPITDNEFTTESALKYDGVPAWNTPMSKDALSLYMKLHKGDVPAYAYPMRATNFADLPAAYIEAAEIDSLHDDAINYANALMQADVKVELNDIEGAAHGFENIRKSPITIEAIKRRIAAFNAAFGL